MCGCGGSEAVNKPESSDLIAIIHPIPAPSTLSETSTLSSRRGSASSYTSTASAASASVVFSQLAASRLRFSNSLPHAITSTTSPKHYSSAETLQSTTVVSSSTLVLDKLHVRIHRYGFPSDVKSMPNPVVYSFPLATGDAQPTSCGVRLDLGLGGEGVLGRTVSLCDEVGTLVGEGVLGRIEL